MSNKWIMKTSNGQIIKVADKGYEGSPGVHKIQNRLYVRSDRGIEPLKLDEQGLVKVHIKPTTTVVNFYAGPGAGKSVMATSVFSSIKKKHIRAEYVSEVAKQWAWEKRQPVSFDQFYLFGQQSRSEYTKFGQVDYLITDSPVPLCAYFTKVYGTLRQRETLKNMAFTYLEMCEKESVIHKHFFLERIHAYDPQGRFQTEEEAVAMDEDQFRFFQAEMGLEIQKIPANEEGMQEVLLKLGVE
jgi:hypothetical protein